MLNIRDYPPGSLPSDTWLLLPPRESTTCLAAAISSSLAPTPRHTNRALGDFSTNTSLVFRLEAEASTWRDKCTHVRGGNKESLHTMFCVETHKGVWWKTAHLYSTRSTGGALPDVEEACVGSLHLSTFTWCSSAMDNHGFALKQAHQVGRLLALSHSHLWMKAEPLRNTTRRLF